MYKRQEQQLAVSFVPSDLIEETGPVKTEDAEVPAQEEESVSYTHLDVYKRQKKNYAVILLHQKK